MDRPFGLIKVYRALTLDQGYQAMANHPITAKTPKANYSMQAHVEDGRRYTQYISASKAEGKSNVLNNYAKPNPNYNKPCSSYVIEIETDNLLESQVHDISNGIDPQTGRKFTGIAYGYARKDAEVLISGTIPTSAYKVIREPVCP